MAGFYSTFPPTLFGRRSVEIVDVVHVISQIGGDGGQDIAHWVQAVAPGSGRCPLRIVRIRSVVASGGERGPL